MCIRDSQNNGSLVENIEDIENVDMEEVMDEMINELNNKIIPIGEELLEEIATGEVEVETVDDPVEELLRPTRERKEPERLTYSQMLMKSTVESCD